MLAVADRAGGGGGTDCDCCPTLSSEAVVERYSSRAGGGVGTDCD